VESLDLKLNYDPAVLPKGVDPSTSEGKAAIRAAILRGLKLLTYTAKRARYWTDEDAIAEALTAE